MAYIVLVAGSLMALIGVMAVITGYPIIQVERGWATFIAGSSLMAGGLVTIALGFVLRAMVDLKKALSAGRSAIVAVAAPAEPLVPAEIVPHHAPPPLVGASMVAVPAAVLALTEKPEPTDTIHPESETAPLPDWIDQVPVAPRVVQEPEPPAAHPVTAEPDVFRSPPIDDWLDRAFADIAHNPEPPAPHRAEPALIADGDTLYADKTRPSEKTIAAEPATHEAVSVANHDAVIGHQKPAAETLAANPAPHQDTESAVIGRYEADGTFYTMYADGSIEAQSDAGLYRFASMAELKAFIES